MQKSRRNRVALAATGLAVLLGAALSAQVASRNVNMVSGGTFPGGDPFLQKQNEPSIAMSTRNACHLLAGANDYRAVNLPGLPDDQEVGDAWLGWYESLDCGKTWYSTLVPGYPQDTSPEGVASPVKGLSAGADPVVRSGAAGSFYYLFIAFNRGSNVGKLALARAIDHNDRESYIDAYKISDVAARKARSPIRYVGTTTIASGSGGRFVDKPSLAVFPGAGTCTMDGETIPATNVYTAWSEFVGNSPDSQRSKIYFARSADCGATLADPATKLSEGYPLGQGTVIAVNPNNPNEIVVVWRQIRNDKDRDALLFVRSTDGGRSFTKALPIPGFEEGIFAPFDQRTTSTARGNDTTTFRTTALPAAAWADDGFLYVAISQVPGAPTGTLGGAEARITMTRTANTTTWAPATPVVATGAAGQQFMPALAYAAGQLQMVWYDVRFDESEQTLEPLIDEKQAIDAVRRRRTIDLLGARAAIVSGAQWPPVFAPFGVSQPDYNEPGVAVGPRVSQYPIGDPLPATRQGNGPRQLQFNRANLLLYGGGSVPFMGDYIDIMGVPFVQNATGQWVVNGMANRTNLALNVFQAAWTDNRDARIGNATTNADGSTAYTKPLTLPAGATLRELEPCEGGVDNTATRDANVYTSRITQDFTLSVPANSKRITPANGVVRAFALQITNNTPLTPGTTTPEPVTRYKLTLTDPNASFSRRTFSSSRTAAACTQIGTRISEIFVDVLPKSSAARTVYVSCAANPTTAVVVSAEKPVAPGSNEPPLVASVVLNPDPSGRPMRDSSGNVLGPETHTPDAENPDAENPDAENPDAENPDAENPDAENPDAENPDAENPDAENPDAENPDAENPDAENPDAENATLEDGYQDVSADITNSGDTTSSYQVQVQTNALLDGYRVLLLGRTVYSTPTSIKCHLVQKRTNQQAFAIPLESTDLRPQPFADENDSRPTHATFVLRPGESIRVTARFVYDTPTKPNGFCSPDPDSPDYCFDKLVIKTQAQAPNTGETEPDEDTVGTLPTVDLTATGAITMNPAVAVGQRGIVDVPVATLQNIGTLGASEVDWGYFYRLDDTGGNGTSTGNGGNANFAGGANVPFGPRRITTPAPFIEGILSGSHNLLLIMDPGNGVTESNEVNNVLASDATINIRPYALQFTPPTPSSSTPTAFDVAFQRLTLSGAFEANVSGATLSLQIEGPALTDNSTAVPGIPEGAPIAGTELTEEGTGTPLGIYTFSIPVIPDANGRRYVISVTFNDSAPLGVGPVTMRFQTNVITP